MHLRQLLFGAARGEGPRVETLVGLLAGEDGRVAVEDFGVELFGTEELAATATLRLLLLLHVSAHVHVHGEAFEAVAKSFADVRAAGTEREQALTIKHLHLLRLFVVLHYPMDNIPPESLQHIPLNFHTTTLLPVPSRYTVSKSSICL